MNFYAFRARTESSDDYLFLLKADSPQEAANSAASFMGEELPYVYDWQFATEEDADAREAGRLFEGLIPQETDE